MVVFSFVFQKETLLSYFEDSEAIERVMVVSKDRIIDFLFIIDFFY